MRFYYVPLVNVILLSTTILLCVAIPACHGFSSLVTRHYQQQQRPKQRLVCHGSNSNDLHRANNDARTDVRNLLTQRAIQTFMYMGENLRDPHTGKWIETILETSNQLEYHGTAAGYIERLGGTWDGPLLYMMEQPKDVVIVSVKRSGKGHKGWSKHNPYLEDRYVEFHIDIDPISITSRILSIREQLSKEWVTDLNVLADANSRILESYFVVAKLERAKSNATIPASVVFERTAVNLLNNHTSFQAGGSSAFRKGNFDLLYNLCTQASIHRLLRSLPPQDIAFAWLRDFYVQRVKEYFDGDQPYGRADDFMDALLRSSPSVVTTKDGTIGLADPMGLAEQIIQLRNDIVQEWKEIMMHVPQDHTQGIRKVLLTKQMAAWGSTTPLEGSSSTTKDAFQ